MTPQCSDLIRRLLIVLKFWFLFLMVFPNYTEFPDWTRICPGGFLKNIYRFCLNDCFREGIPRFSHSDWKSIFSYFCFCSE